MAEGICSRQRKRPSVIYTGYFLNIRGVKKKYLTPPDIYYRITLVMEKIVRQGMLYDLYGELLTEHQREIFGDLVNNDMSLSEIAESYGISRQGVHDVIRRCDKQLEAYESKLHLLEKQLSKEG